MSAEIDYLLERLHEVQDELAATRAKLEVTKEVVKGDTARAGILLDAKDHWRERAERAEAALAQVGADRDHAWQTVLDTEAQLAEARTMNRPEMVAMVADLKRELAKARGLIGDLLRAYAFFDDEKTGAAARARAFLAGRPAPAAYKWELGMPEFCPKCGCSWLSVRRHYRDDCDGADPRPGEKP